MFARCLPSFGGQHPTDFAADFAHDWPMSGQVSAELDSPNDVAAVSRVHAALAGLAPYGPIVGSACDVVELQR